MKELVLLNRDASGPLRQHHPQESAEDDCIVGSVHGVLDGNWGFLRNSHSQSFKLVADVPLYEVIL